MFKRILVPLDGSARAERAIPVAARIARASGGSLILLRVVNASIEFCPSPVSESTMVQYGSDRPDAHIFRIDPGMRIGHQATQRL